MPNTIAYSGLAPVSPSDFVLMYDRLYLHGYLYRTIPYTVLWADQACEVIRYSHLILVLAWIALSYHTTSHILGSVVLVKSFGDLYLVLVWIALPYHTMYHMWHMVIQNYFAHCQLTAIPVEAYGAYVYVLCRLCCYRIILRVFLSWAIFRPYTFSRVSRAKLTSVQRIILPD